MLTPPAPAPPANTWLSHLVITQDAATRRSCCLPRWTCPAPSRPLATSHTSTCGQSMSPTSTSSARCCWTRTRTCRRWSTRCALLRHAFMLLLVAAPWRSYTPPAAGSSLAMLARHLDSNNNCMYLAASASSVTSPAGQLTWSGTSCLGGPFYQHRSTCNPLTGELLR
jgi:hypothetical protein